MSPNFHFALARRRSFCSPMKKMKYLFTVLAFALMGSSYVSALKIKVNTDEKKNNEIISELAQIARDFKDQRVLRKGKKKAESKSKKMGSKKKGSKKKDDSDSCSKNIYFREGEDIFIAPTLCSGQCLEADSPSPTIQNCNTTVDAQKWDIVSVEGSPGYQIVSASTGLCIAPPECYTGFDSGSSNYGNILLVPCASPLTEWVYMTGFGFQSWSCYTDPSTLGSKTVTIDFDDTFEPCTDGIPFTDYDDFYYNFAFFLDACHLS